MEAPVSEPPKTVEYKILDKPWVRDYFKEMTLKLIRDTEGFDSLFFLDRSARPIAHLYRRVFSALYPDRKRPEIRYLNIGAEKQRLKESGEGKKIPRTRDEFVEKFGAENIEELEHFLKASQGQKRIIVDDLFSTGSTATLARNIVHELDSGHEYGFSIFDREKELYIMPWSGYDTFVQNRNSDFNDPSFLTKRDPNPKRREEGMQLRAELEKLAGEIATEKGVTLPPIHPYWKDLPQ